MGGLVASEGSRGLHSAIRVYGSRLCNLPISLLVVLLLLLTATPISFGRRRKLVSGDATPHFNDTPPLADTTLLKIIKSAELTQRQSAENRTLRKERAPHRNF